MINLPVAPKSKAEFSRNPEAVGAVWDFAIAISQMPAKLVTPSGAAAFALGKPVIVGNPPNLVLQIPLLFPQAYVMPTGPVSRATFDTGTVTTAQLAQRVAALIQDLQATGQINTQR